MHHCSEDDHIFFHALAKQYALYLPLLARLYKKTPDPKTLWELSGKDLVRYTHRLSQKTISALQKRKEAIDLASARTEVHDLRARGIELLCIRDQGYSDALRLIHEPPILLYARGNTQLLQPRGSLNVSIIGSRKISDYGRYVTDDIGRTLKFFNCTIVSGLALGVDARAHEAALENHLPTIAVLGSPITDSEITPPRHKGLAKQILDAGGLLLSEYPPSTPCRPEFFPERNRIIAGLSTLTIVVEAAEKSGSLITARLATEEYRDVFAVPGQIYAPQSAGTNQLIELGTRPLSSMNQLRDYVAEQLQINAKSGTQSQSHTEPSVAPILHPILAAFDNPLQALTIEELQEASGFGTDELYVELAELELSGMIVLQPNGTYKKG